jgi:hypothetical protein
MKPIDSRHRLMYILAQIASILGLIMLHVCDSTKHMRECSAEPAIRDLFSRSAVSPVCRACASVHDPHLHHLASDVHILDLRHTMYSRNSRHFTDTIIYRMHALSKYLARLHTVLLPCR